MNDMRYFTLIFLLLSFSTFGQIAQWAAKFGGSGNDICTDMITDAAGNIYMVGLFKGSVDFDPGPGVLYLNEANSGAGDIYCVKLSRTGQLIWAKIVGGAKNYSAIEEMTPSITLDNSGNIYIAGHYQNTIDMDPGPATLYLPPPSETFSTGNFISKFTNNGTLVWSKVYGAAFGQHCSRRIKTDAAGNVYLGGYFIHEMVFPTATGTFTLTAAPSKFDIYVAKCDANGNFTYAFNVGDDANDDFLRDMDVSPNGNVVITGSFRGQVDFDPRTGYDLVLTSVSNRDDAFVAKYNGSTTECEWAKSFALAGNTFNEVGNSVAFDTSGNVISSGLFKDTIDFDPAPDSTFNLTSVGSSSIYFLKLGAAGNFIWANTIGAQSPNGVYSYSQKAYRISTDAADAIYVSGDYISHMDADPGPAVYSLNANGESYQVFNLKLDSSGEFEWAMSLGATTNKSATGRAISVNAFGETIVVGRYMGSVDFNPLGAPMVITSNDSASHDSFVMLLQQNSLSVKDNLQVGISAAPNPFTDLIEVTATANISSVELYDMSGRLVLRSVSPRINTGSLLSGVYLMNVTASDGLRNTIKIIKR